MAVIKEYICDECGTKSQRADRWLALHTMDLRDLEHSRKVFGIKSEVDFCSPGCVIRWVSKHLTAATRTEEERTALAV